MALTCCDLPDAAKVTEGPGGVAATLGLERLEPRLDVPGFTVGSDPSDEGQLVWEVTELVFLEDGSLVVADGRSRSLRRFTADGRVLWSVGRAGEGPGEFRRIDSVAALPGDTLVVLDALNERLTHIAPNGDIAQSETVAMDFGPWPPHVRALPDGSLVLVTHVAADLSRLDEEWRLRADSMMIQVRNRPAGAMDTLQVVPGDERASRIVDAGGGQIAIQNPPLPFGRRTVIGQRGPEILVARSDRYSVDLRNALTGGSRSLELSVLEEPITADEMARVPDGARELLERFDTPPLRPSFDGLIVSSEGELWLRRFRVAGDAGEHWWRVNRDGVPTGLLTVPPRLRVHAIHSGRAAFVQTDSLGVEQVVVAPMEPAT